MRTQTRIGGIASLSVALAATTLIAAPGSFANVHTSTGRHNTDRSTAMKARRRAKGSRRALRADLLNGRLSMAKLVAAANAEGTLNWTTSLAGPVVDDLVAGFEAKYPKITVNVDRGDEGTIIPQEIQSMKAGVPLGDVFEVTSEGALILKDAHALAPFRTAATKHIPSRFRITKGSDTLAVSDRVSYISFGYNKKAIPASAVPKNVEGLANPALKGKLAMESDTTSEDWIGAVLHQLGNSRGKAFLKKLGANNVAQTSDSGAALMALVASGQYGGSPSVFHNHEQQQAAAGAPVGWKPIEPVVANEGQLGIFSNVKHPAAAMLFIDWELGPGGVKILKKEHYTPPEDKQPFKSWIPTSAYSNAQRFSTAEQGWAKLQQQDFGS